MSAQKSKKSIIKFWGETAKNFKGEDDSSDSDNTEDNDLKMTNQSKSSGSNQFVQKLGQSPTDLPQLGKQISV